MSNIWGNKRSISIFGESHGKCIGITINGLEAGFSIDMDIINRDMQKRAPGQAFTTKRQEADGVQIISGMLNGLTTGAPLTAIIKNNDHILSDYEATRYIPRPSHADYSVYMHYEGLNDYRGGGATSGRMTAALTIAGAIVRQLLARENISIVAKANYNEEQLREAIKDKDSIGGRITCAIEGVKPGIGEPFFNSIESNISSLAFSVPGVKAIEFGDGFALSDMKGSIANDAYFIEEGIVKTKTNHNGGILGGMATGSPIVFTVGIKPTPSIGKKQDSVNLKTMQNTKLEIEGRHDPCIVIRAEVVIEAIAAIAIWELI